MHNPTRDVDMIRKIALVLGCAGLAVAALMAFVFGLSMSLSHAVLLGLLTLSGSVLWPYAGHLRASGAGRSATMFLVIASGFLAAEYFSHIGYTVGQRVMETEDTGFKNAAYKLKQESVPRNAGLLAGMKADLEKMQAANAWAAAVSADGLRAQLAPMDLAIEQETARGGCGPKCLGLTRDKAAVQDKIAIVEKVDDLTKQIATMQNLVNMKEGEATTAEFKSSAVVAQTNFVAQLGTLSLDPDRSAQIWTQIGIGAMLALVTTFFAPTMFAIAWGPDTYRQGVARKLGYGTAPLTSPAVHEVMAAPQGAINITMQGDSRPAVDGAALLRRLQQAMAEGRLHVGGGRLA
jgi:hypothetical protein